MIFQDPENPDYDWKKPLLAFIVIVGLATYLHEAKGYSTFDTSPRWKSTYEYFIDESCKDPDKIVDAFEQIDWLARDLETRYLGRTVRASDSLNEKNVVFCSDDFGESLMFAPGGIETRQEILTEAATDLVIGRTDRS